MDVSWKYLGLGDIGRRENQMAGGAYKTSKHGPGSEGTRPQFRPSEQENHEVQKHGWGIAG